MADDWQVGDLALCVKGDWKTLGRPPAGMPQRGQVFRVADVRNASEYYDIDRLCLVFEAYGIDHWFDHEHFRKIKPLSDDETREFKADLEQDQRVADLEHVMQGIKWHTSWYIDKEGNTYRIDRTSV